MALERDLKKLLKEQVGKGKIDRRVLQMPVERKYVEQEDLTLWYVRWRYSERIIRCRNVLEKRFKEMKGDKFFRASLKYDLFYYLLAKSLGIENAAFYCGEDLFY